MGRLGGGITLIVVGAILSFAVQVNIPGVGRYTLGIILMLAGLLVLILWFMMDQQRRRSHTLVEQRPSVVYEEADVVDERVDMVEPRRRRRFLG
jgi:uncharacterized membrane protein